MRNLSTALFDKEKITTTLAKAKELRPFAEKLVTMSKKETLHARRQVLLRTSTTRRSWPSCSTRSRPATRSVRAATRGSSSWDPRRGDNAEMAIIELVGSERPAARPGGAEEGRAEAAKGRKAKAAKDQGQEEDQEEDGQEEDQRRRRSAGQEEGQEEGEPRPATKEEGHQATKKTGRRAAGT